MSFSSLAIGAVVDIAKKFLFEKGKKELHELKESATGTKLGQIISYRKKEGNQSLVLFVHGFSGNAAETFGCTPELLINTSEFEGWDVSSIGYSSDIFPSIGKGLWSVNPDISKISLYLNTLLSIQFEDYNRVALVAHSMGGLVAQRAILDADASIFSKISHLVLFGTPSAGLKKATWFRFWNNQIEDLSSSSDFILKLRKDWTNRFNDTYDFAFKTIAGSKDEFVPVASSLAPFAEKYQGIIEGNHINMIKPIGMNDTNHQSYQVILGLLTKNHSEIKSGTAEEQNLLFGEYNKIIANYLPNATKLSLVSLAGLVFALESSGRSAEALTVLQSHPEANSDSDTLGIIGGRYKRSYILNGLEENLDNAITNYSKGLALSQSKNDRFQNFYLSINLAFLNVFGKRNKTEMAHYAQLALDNCNLDSIAMFELATIAEANLYLGKTDEAEIFYKKAAEVAGSDIRAKQSIYSNAYFGYQALTGSKDKEGAFLMMLEEVFLN